MDKKNFYYGIDLGTTNSVMAESIVTSSGNTRTNVVEIKTFNRDGQTCREKIIPSVVKFNDETTADGINYVVGDSAKASMREGRIVRSVKSMMGEKQYIDHLEEDIKERTPSEISAKILKWLTTKSISNGDKEDIIVAVPASFPAASQKATKEAMRIAGINTDEKEHKVIITEPLAVLYAFLAENQQGKISQEIFDITKEQHILVYDIGGGTLDIAIYKIPPCSDEVEMIAKHESIAYSSHTPFAGDNFDLAIAEFMYQRFINKYGLSPQDKKTIMIKLKEQAESIKKQYTDEIGLYEKDPMDVSFEISIPYLYQDYRYDDTLYPEDIDDIIKPFLAKHLKLDNVYNLLKLHEEDMRGNIIYPILECLAKAKRKLGNDFEITTVLLNGGMTYFPPIKERLNDFFGFKCQDCLNGDLSVARGASYYHYCCHEYKAAVHNDSKNFHSVRNYSDAILGTSLNIGLDGSYITRIAEAGTPLPYQSEYVEGKLSMATKSNMLCVEIYSGEGETKNLPCEITSRKIIKLDKTYNEGTSIEYSLYIDGLQSIRLQLFVDKKLIGMIETLEYKQIESDDKTASKLISPDSVKVLAANEINMLSDWRKNKPKDFDNKYKVLMERLKKASNSQDVISTALSKLEKATDIDDTIVGDMYEILLSLENNMSDADRQRVFNHAKKQFESKSFVFKRTNGYVKHKAAEVIKKIGTDEEHFTDTLKSNPVYAKYFSNVINEEVDKN